MNNDINALRSHLFETLQALRDKDNPMEVERARAISEVAQTVINTAKVELDFLKHTGTDSSHFVPDPQDAPSALPTPDNLPAMPRGAVVEPGQENQVRTGTVVRDHAAGVTRHRME